MAAQQVHPRTWQEASRQVRTTGIHGVSLHMAMAPMMCAGEPAGWLAAWHPSNIWYSHLMSNAAGLSRKQLLAQDMVLPWLSRRRFLKYCEDHSYPKELANQDYNWRNDHHGRMRTEANQEHDLT